MTVGKFTGEYVDAGHAELTEEDKELLALAKHDDEQKNSIQDDIADMFNEENPEGTYQRTTKNLNKAVEKLGADIYAALDIPQKKV